MGALLNNITGNRNTASGYQALFNNSTGFGNTASGVQALQSNTTGNDNTASGRDALLSNTTGSTNTAVGVNALLFNIAGADVTEAPPERRRRPQEQPERHDRGARGRERRRALGEDPGDDQDEDDGLGQPD